MLALHNLGVAVAIDDFGTGYSSLAYLKLPAVAYLKIDRSFVTGLPMNANDVAITEVMVAIARSLDLHTIAGTRSGSGKNRKGPAWPVEHVVAQPCLFSPTCRSKARGPRKLIYHRWGGLGNHRYQVGFSGDSIISWASLGISSRASLATASNVGQAATGATTWVVTRSATKADPATRRINPELYIRWMQFGARSPIMRTCTPPRTSNLTKEPRLRALGIAMRCAIPCSRVTPSFRSRTRWAGRRTTRASRSCDP